MEEEVDKIENQNVGKVKYDPNIFFEKSKELREIQNIEECVVAGENKESSVFKKVVIILTFLVVVFGVVSIFYFTEIKVKVAQISGQGNQIVIEKNNTKATYVEVSNISEEYRVLGINRQPKDGLLGYLSAILVVIPMDEYRAMIARDGCEKNAPEHIKMLTVITSNEIMEQNISQLEKIIQNQQGSFFLKLSGKMSRETSHFYNGKSVDLNLQGGFTVKDILLLDKAEIIR